jgi:hypothetical protein
MDQVPYPGPPLLFHIRFGTLFCLLWTVDFIMLVFAIDNTLANGVGGAVLFASEVGAVIVTSHGKQADTALLLVRNFDGQCTQFPGTLRAIEHRITACQYAGWSQCASMGEQKHVYLLHRTCDR